MKSPFDKHHLPLFPLNTVIFINGILPLQIFEQRYLNLVKTCMKDQHGFITSLISHGKEVADTPDTYAIGSYVEIIDWDSLDNNLLSITIQARQRVRIKQTHLQEDNLISAEITYLDNLIEDENDVLDDELLSLLKTLQQHPFVIAKYPNISNDSFLDSAYKLCELLPATNLDKQNLLEAKNTRLLLDQLKAIVMQLEA